MAQEKIGVALIGAGSMARTHMKSMVQTRQLALRAVCDSNEAAATAMAAEFGEAGCGVYTQYAQAIAAPGIDAVVIVTPNCLHYDILMEAIRANKAYYLEKPVAMDQQQALEMKQETEKRKLPHVVGFSYRFYPALRYAKTIVDSGALGQLYHFYAIYVHRPKPSVPRFWRFEKEMAGTGTLGDLGSHTLDTARLLVGEVDSVLGSGGIFIPQRPNPAGQGMLPVDTDDYFNLMAKMENGTAATFSFSRVAYGRQNYQRFELYGSKGTMVYNQELGADSIEVCVGDFYADRHRFVPLEIPREFHVSLMQAFENVINGGDRMMAADINDGYQVQRILDAAVASDEKGTWVKV